MKPSLVVKAQVPILLVITFISSFSSLVDGFSPSSSSSRISSLSIPQPVLRHNGGVRVGSGSSSSLHLPSIRSTKLTSGIRRSRSGSTTSATEIHMSIDPTPFLEQTSNIISTATAESSSSSTTTLLSMLEMTQSQAEQLAGPFFGLSLFPYLLFLYFLNTSTPAITDQQPITPKGITIGFATCLLFVFLTIPAAIASQVLYGVSLADSDWLHGSAESLLTITNLVTVVAFRQAFRGKEIEQMQQQQQQIPLSVTSYQPMISLVTVLTVLAGITAFVPAFMNAEVHTPYLNGLFDLPKDFMMRNFGAHDEPLNALSVGCWIIHISSLVEFLVAMGFAWRWADIVQNPKWKGLTWGLIPLHSSGITACTYHLFYNSIPFLVPLQAFLTCVGNTTAAYAAYRIAVSYGWNMEDVEFFALLRKKLLSWNDDSIFDDEKEELVLISSTMTTTTSSVPQEKTSSSIIIVERAESPSLIGFEDLGDAFSEDTDYTFLIKLFLGCTIASYLIKYGELMFEFPFLGNGSLFLALGFIFVPSLLNALKWYKRSLDPTFEGWF